jgi:hypothetical protein
MPTYCPPCTTGSGAPIRLQIGRSHNASEKHSLTPQQVAEQPFEPFGNSLSSDANMYDAEPINIQI